MPVAGADFRSIEIVAGILQHLARQLDDRLRHRRGEEERLPFRRQMPEHAADVGEEAHVQHAVGFIEDEDLEPLELRVAVLEVIEQTSGRGDDDVDAAAEGVLLRPHADAAVDRGAGQRRVHGQLAQMLVDLRRQLARRREDQRARRAALLADQPVENRQQERRGLAAAGHGAGEHVLAGDGRRNGVVLNRRRSLETELFDAAQEIGVESK